MPDGAVIPMDGAVGDIARTDGDVWQSLASGSGALVTWQRVGESTSTTTSGEVLAPGSAFARQLVTIADRAGARGLLESGSTLFRLELPTGQTMRNLVPAVGGGFRGLTRAADGSKIAGHARLIPVSGAAAGAGLALGPVVGLMALSIGAEMIAHRQQDQMLKAIRRAVEGLERHEQQRFTAQLMTAEQALQAADAAVLDQVTIPQGVGLASAVTGLRDVKNQALGWLSQWEVRVARLSRDGGSTDLDAVKTALDVGIGGHESFPSHVWVLYRALVLDSWSHFLTAAESALLNPGQTMENLQGVLQRRLVENSGVFERLRQLLLTLNESPLEASFWTWPGSGAEANALDGTLGRLVHVIVDTPTMPSLLTATNRQVVEVIRTTDGAVRVLRPVEGAA